MQQGNTAVELSVIAPAHNESLNLPDLIKQLHGALESTGMEFEVIVVDDGSTDGTARILAALSREYPKLRGLRLVDTPPGRGHGQSTAFYVGMRKARGELLALIDADLQNDPADLPGMIQLLRRENADLVQGDRSANRRDGSLRVFSSWVGRVFRRFALADTIRDTGCSMRVLTKEVAQLLPLQYAGLHRFIPVYARMLGFKVVETPVHHRSRAAGESKYGVWNRAIPGMFDLLAVRWMRKRLRPTECVAIEPAGREAE